MENDWSRGRNDIRGQLKAIVVVQAKDGSVLGGCSGGRGKVD